MFIADFIILRTSCGQVSFLTLAVYIRDDASLCTLLTTDLAETPAVNTCQSVSGRL